MHANQKNNNVKVMLPNGVRLFVPANIKLTELQVKQIVEATTNLNRIAPIKFVNINTDFENPLRAHNLVVTFGENALFGTN